MLVSWILGIARELMVWQVKIFNHRRHEKHRRGMDWDLVVACREYARKIGMAE